MSRWSVHLIGRLLLFLCLLNAQPSWALGSTEDALSGSVLKVGLYQNAPKIYRDELGQPAGFWPKVLAHVAAEQAWVVEYQDCQWQECLAALESGQLDLMPDVAMTPEREQRFNFSSLPVLNSWSRIYVRKGETLNSILELDGKRVAVVSGSSQERQLRKDAKAFGIYPEFVVVASFDAAFDAVQHARADAAISNVMFGSQQKDNFNLHETGLVMYPADLRFASRKDLDPRYLTILSDGLADLQDQQYSVYHQQYVALFDDSEKIIAPSLLLTRQQRDWLKAHPDIRLAINAAWPPMDYVDKQGNAKGIGVNFIRLLNRRLEGVLKIVPGEWNDIYQGVQEHRYDALMDITPRKEREELFHFTEPYVSVPHVIFSRYSEAYLGSIEALFGHSVAIEKGFFTVAEIRRRYPDITVVEFESTELALQAVSEGRVYAYIGNRAVATYLIQEKFFSNLRSFGKIEITASINAIGVRKDWPILRDILQLALDDLSDAEMHSALSSWLDIAPVRLQANQLGLSIKEKAWLDRGTKVRIAFDPDYAPYSFRDEKGRYVGVAPDFVDYLQAMTGVEFEVVADLSWTEMMDALKAKRIDAIATVSKNPEREKVLAFTQSYIPTPLVLVTRQEDEFIQSAEDLPSVRVALVEGYSSTQMILKDYPKIKPLLLENLTETLSAVANNKVDATIGVLGVSDYLSKKHGLANLRIAGKYRDSRNAQNFAVRNDWPELAAILDKALAKMDKGDVNGIFQKWLSLDIASLWTKDAKEEAKKELNKSLELSDTERAWLKANPVLRVGVDRSWAPMESVNEQGEFEGIAIDNIQRVTELLGLELELMKPSPWSEVLAASKTGKVDVLSAVKSTTERRKTLDFTRPYVNFPIVIVTRTETPVIENMEVLSGKKVIVPKGYATYDLLLENHPDIEVVTAENIQQALLAVSEQKAFAFVGSMAGVSYAITQSGASNLKIAGHTPYFFGISLGMKKGNALLLGLMQKALDAISEKERSAMVSKWFSVTYEQKVDYRYLWQLVGLALVVIAIVLVWNHRLQREVGRRRRTELALVEAKEEADSANRAKSQFLATMSHEIRTPLNGVIGISELLQGTPLLEQQEYYVNLIQSSGGSLLNVINDILDFSKLEAGQVKLESIDFNLEELVSETIALFRLTAAAKSLSLLVSVDPQVPSKVNGDQQRLRQVITNLLSNAIKFTESGEISLKVFLVEGQGSSSSATCLRVEVADTGIGMTAEQQQRLFQAFEQASVSTTRKYGGTGLGLSISKRLIELMQGHIGVLSHDHNGSCFWFEIPNVSSMDVDDSLSLELDASLPKLKVVSIEDKPLLQEVVVGQLEALGCSVVECHSSAEFQRYLADDKVVQPDFILSGYALAKEWGLAEKGGLDNVLSSADFSHIANSQRVLLVDTDDMPDSSSCTSMGFHHARLRPIGKEAMETLLRGQSSLLAKQKIELNSLRSNESLKVLVAEDNSVNVMVIQGMLKKLDHQVTVVADGQQALECVKAAHDQFDLILMDCEMPIMDGFTATEKIREYERDNHLAKIYVAALTAHVLPEFKARAKQVGMDSFICKPVSFANLTEVLAEMD